MDHTNHLEPGLWLTCWLGKAVDFKHAINPDHLPASLCKSRALPTSSLWTAGGVTEFGKLGEEKGGDWEVFHGNKDAREAEARRELSRIRAMYCNPGQVRNVANSPGWGNDLFRDGLGSETNTDLCKWFAKTNSVSRPYLCFEGSGLLDVVELCLKREECIF